jgi:NAD(P)-dependent dehydrogenase (short-subunit alcohol dehydrogenase family)
MNPRLDGKLALVTGGNAGIGLETCKGLIKRGAEVVILARNVQKAKYAMHIIENELNSRVHFVSLDLADLNSVTSAVENLGTLFPDRKIDVFIANAGIWPKKYSNSIQGYEIAYATNVLGHHVLIRNLQNRLKINTDSRIVMLTGDIYILADNCTPNFLYKSIKGRQEAYSRSKLGNLWWVHEWSKRNKGIEVYAVHPGIVDSNLTCLQKMVLKCLCFAQLNHT